MYMLYIMHITRIKFKLLGFIEWQCCNYRHNRSFSVNQLITFLQPKHAAATESARLNIGHTWKCNIGHTWKCNIGHTWKCILYWFSFSFFEDMSSWIFFSQFQMLQVEWKHQHSVYTYWQRISHEMHVLQHLSECHKCHLWIDLLKKKIFFNGLFPCRLSFWWPFTI